MVLALKDFIMWLSESMCALYTVKNHNVRPCRRDVKRVVSKKHRVYSLPLPPIYSKEREQHFNSASGPFMTYLLAFLSRFPLTIPPLHITATVNHTVSGMPSLTSRMWHPQSPPRPQVLAKSLPGSLPWPLPCQWGSFPIITICAPRYDVNSVRAGIRFILFTVVNPHLAQCLAQSWCSINICWMNEWMNQSIILWLSGSGIVLGTLQRVRNCFMSFTYINSFNYHYHTIRWELLSTKFYRWGIGSTEPRQSGARNCSLTHYILLPQSESQEWMNRQERIHMWEFTVLFSRSHISWSYRVYWVVFFIGLGCGWVCSCKLCHKKLQFRWNPGLVLSLLLLNRCRNVREGHGGWFLCSGRSYEEASSDCECVG